MHCGCAQPVHTASQHPVHKNIRKLGVLQGLLFDHAFMLKQGLWRGGQGGAGWHGRQAGTEGRSMAGNTYYVGGAALYSPFKHLARPLSRMGSNNTHCGTFCRGLYLHSGYNARAWVRIII